MFQVAGPSDLSDQSAILLLVLGAINARVSFYRNPEGLSPVLICLQYFTKYSGASPLRHLSTREMILKVIRTLTVNQRG